jgi:hypothetical protein
MNTNDIREMVAKAQIEQAIAAVISLTNEDDNLKQLSIQISASFLTYKHNIIAGILSNAEERQEIAIITNKILNLIRVFEISQIKIFKDNIQQLKEVITQSNEPGSKGLIDELDDIEKQVGENKSKDELHPSIIEKIKSFYNRINDPQSTERKIISNVKDAIQFVSKIISVVKLIPF